MTDTVLLDVADEVATLTLNRPAALNALSVEMMQDLSAAVRELSATPRVGAVVVTGAGDHFMAGGDLKDFARNLHLAPEARLATFRAMIAQYINPTVEMLQALPQPVVAKVRGACAGFGLSLMLGCDLAVCADSAVFTTAYSAIALSGDGGASYFLPRLVGRRKAAELLLLADRFDAREAQRLALVSRVVPAAELDAETTRLVDRLLRGPRHAHAEIKRLLAASHDNQLEAQLQSEAEAFARCAATGDFGEGVTAFLEKRKPAFGGA
ncbi:enoyl-CoA hydratase/isomerase family protein [Pseudothauera rhizosphaerae]|uniref:Enoyl-CoA hydratase n=1 Tax=Pseudothauera rhizosphaerae TaxID=2565932 RepID=A0A4S4AL69_9RHOO|nr:enoyl-CoA hydratase-related protein [Pseudothauera rhizosphaerae]THF60236.1 enoyl-CoA hydratase [Pseudothauera rhizosphaerae]